MYSINQSMIPKALWGCIWSSFRFAKIWPCQRVRPRIQFICCFVCTRDTCSLQDKTGSVSQVIPRLNSPWKACLQGDGTECLWLKCITTIRDTAFRKEQLKVAPRNTGVFVWSLFVAINQTGNSTMYRFSWNSCYKMCWSDSKISSWVQTFSFCIWGFATDSKCCVVLKVNTDKVIHYVHTKQIQSGYINLLTNVHVSFPETSNSEAAYPRPAGIEIRDPWVKVSQVATGNNCCPWIQLPFSILTRNTNLMHRLEPN